MSIYALGVGAWLYHAIERLILARPPALFARQSRCGAATGDGRHHGLAQAEVVRSLVATTDLPARRPGSFRSCRCCAGWTTQNRANRLGRGQTTWLTDPVHRAIIAWLHSTALPAENE